MNYLDIFIVTILFTTIAIQGYFIWVLRRQVLNILQLSDSDEGQGIKKLYSKYIKKLEEVDRKTDMTIKRIEKADEKSKNYISEIKLIRFNPFKDTGGDQSFVMSLLNTKKTGIILTGLYSRSGSRVYAKTIREGKSNATLSDEETQLLEK